MTKVEKKTAYPYITEFKKEPFKSFVLIETKDISSFYLSQYSQILKFYQQFNEKFLTDKSLNLENIYWLLLLRKYLKEPRENKKEEIYKFIKSCEVEIHDYDYFGFKSAPEQGKKPDIWSTYYALSSLSILGMLNEYINSKEKNEFIRKINNFINSHKKGHKFLHCFDKDCEICKKESYAKTLYFVSEILKLIGIEIRLYTKEFQSYIDHIRKDSSIVYKLAISKALDLDSEVKDKEIENLYQFQKSDGGFSYENTEGSITNSFWIAYILELYSWKLDYNPAEIYSFINKKISDLLDDQDNWNFTAVRRLAKLIILLSYIWKKFIEEIERIIFKQLEKEKFIDVDQIKTALGLTHGIDEIVLFINLSYNFNLKVIDTLTEFNNYIKDFSVGKKLLLKEIFNQIQDNSIISLSDIFKKYKGSSHYEPMKLKEDLFPLLKELMNKHLFIGNIRTRRGISFNKKYYLCLDFAFKKIIITDMEIDIETLSNEKEKVLEIKNDIYNMTLSLNDAVSQIKEEIESYLILDEVGYAKERLKFILRNALMEADFLNENIENSFNEDLKYINIQARLASEISRWKKSYSILQKRLNNLDKYLKEKILEKQELRQFDKILDDLDSKISEIEGNINKELDVFGKYFNEVLENGYSEEKFNLVIQALNRISQYVSKYDSVIYKISQQITTKENKIVKKHKKVINYWIKIKENFDILSNYYSDGFQFFNSNLKQVESINEGLNLEIIELKEKAQLKVNEGKFKDAFEIIKKESDNLLQKKIQEIKDIKLQVSNEIEKKQKLYLLFKHLQDKLENLEEILIDTIAEQVQSLKKGVLEERNRVKFEDFDNFILGEIQRFKKVLGEYKSKLDETKDRKISPVVQGFDKILIDFDNINKKYQNKLTDLKDIIENSDAISMSIMQWEKFSEFLNHEITNLKDEYVNEIITDEMILMCESENTDKVDLKKLSDKLNLKCKALIPRIKEMIDISRIQGDLNEDNKYIIVHTDHYYKIKDLINFTENKLLNNSHKTIGKILALYDSSIKNKTLAVNILEIQNRIDDFSSFEAIIRDQFRKKIEELNINENRFESIEFKKHLEEIIENNISAINSIKISLTLFVNLQNSIGQEFNNLKLSLEKEFSRFFEDYEEHHSYERLYDAFEIKNKKIENKLKTVYEKIDNKIKETLEKSLDSRKFETEIREFVVSNKNHIQKLYDDKLNLINEEINHLKDETFRSKFIDDLNRYKIHLSQLLGTLQARVEDYIDYEEFKRAYSKISKREKGIEIETKEIYREVRNLIKDYDRLAKNFSTKNRHIISDFEKFLKNFKDILAEKVKSLEEMIIKSYVEMAIKAVSNQYLTLSFLQNELKIKKQVIQDRLISLISAGSLKGKYDPRLGLYYEDPDVLKSLNETELEVIKKMNFRFYMFYKHLKNFTSQNYSIFAFLAAILSITLSISTATGGNPSIFIILIISAIIIIIYIIVKKRKQKKV
ncbi:MAG: hypothetical protein ACFE85_13845 [Candidatus Hodarchaeota archaeon]